MKQGMHPLVMIGLVIAAVLFGLALPTWTLSLATVAASNALIALGIVILARTGNVSFGQGLFYAAGGYGVALIANARGAERAIAAGVDEVSLVVSVSETHNRANVRRSTDASFESFGEIVRELRRTRIPVAGALSEYRPTPESSNAAARNSVVLETFSGVA